MTGLFKAEIRRKLFHALGIIFPILYYLTSKVIILQILVPLTIFILLIDYFRNYNKNLQALILFFFSPVMRKDEKENKSLLSGASYFFLGLSITAALFPYATVITSWLVLIFADSFAALMGRAYGKPFIGSKSIIGSLSFFASSMLIACIILLLCGVKISILKILLSTSFATVIELFTDYLHVDDNLAVPVSFCLIYNIL